MWIPLWPDLVESRRAAPGLARELESLKPTIRELDLGHSLRGEGESGIFGIVAWIVALGEALDLIKSASEARGLGPLDKWSDEAVRSWRGWLHHAPVEARQVAIENYTRIVEPILRVMLTTLRAPILSFA